MWNFSYWYPYIIQQTANDNIQIYQVKVDLIKQQLLITDLKGYVLKGYV